MAAFVDEMREVFGDVKFISFVGKTESSAACTQQTLQGVASSVQICNSQDLPVNCKVVPSSKADKRAVEKQRQLERMIADGMIKFGGR